MAFVANFPCFSIVLSLACAAVSSVLGKRWSRRICLTVVTLGLLMSAATLYFTATTGQPVTYIMGQVPAPWGNEMRFGILEPLFAMLFCREKSADSESMFTQQNQYPQITPTTKFLASPMYA